MGSLIAVVFDTVVSDDCLFTAELGHWESLIIKQSSVFQETGLNLESSLRATWLSLIL